MILFNLSQLPRKVAKNNFLLMDKTVEEFLYLADLATKSDSPDQDIHTKSLAELSGKLLEKWSFEIVRSTWICINEDKKFKM